jgi:hypothetical protein
MSTERTDAHASGVYADLGPFTCSQNICVNTFGAAYGLGVARKEDCDHLCAELLPR